MRTPLLVGDICGGIVGLLVWGPSRSKTKYELGKFSSSISGNLLNIFPSSHIQEIT